MGGTPLALAGIEQSQDSITMDYAFLYIPHFGLNVGDGRYTQSFNSIRMLTAAYKMVYVPM